MNQRCAYNASNIYAYVRVGRYEFDAPLDHSFSLGNIRLLAFSEHFLLIDQLVTLASFVRNSLTWFEFPPDSFNFHLNVLLAYWESITFKEQSTSGEFPFWGSRLVSQNFVHVLSRHWHIRLSN
jgi:hypothetical protein